MGLGLVSVTTHWLSSRLSLDVSQVRLGVTTESSNNEREVKNRISPTLNQISLKRSKPQTV